MVERKEIVRYGENIDHKPEPEERTNLSIVETLEACFRPGTISLGVVLNTITIFL